MQSIALTHVSISNFNHNILDMSITCLLFFNLVNIFIIFVSKHELDESLIFYRIYIFLIKNGEIK